MDSELLFWIQNGLLSPSLHDPGSALPSGALARQVLGHARIGVLPEIGHRPRGQLHRIREGRIATDLLVVLVKAGTLGHRHQGLTSGRADKRQRTLVEIHRVTLARAVHRGHHLTDELDFVSVLFDHASGGAVGDEPLRVRTSVV